MRRFIKIGALSRTICIRVVEIKYHTTTTGNRTVPVSRASCKTWNKVFLKGYFPDYLLTYIDLSILSKIIQIPKLNHPDVLFVQLAFL